MSPMSSLPPRSTPTRPDLFGSARGERDQPGAGSRPRPILAPASTAAARGAMTVERVDPADAVRHRDAWIALVDRALEPNAFLDPDFALPAAQHLGAAARPCFVMVWAESGAGSRDLVAVCPVVGGRDPIRGLASLWYHDLSTLGFPLLDRRRAAPALDALLAWVGRGLPRARGLLFRAVPAAGPTADLLRAAAAGGGRSLAVLETWERAALRPGETHERAGAPALSAKGAKEVRRQRRRLAERGALDYVSARTDDEMRGAMERFLALEAGGWKGRAGTALLARPARTAFARTATRLLVRRGLCRLDSLTLDGEPIAMGIVLTAGAVDHLWKIAYREDLARFSPGVQFVLDFTEAQSREGRASLTDSCAVPHHPMIDRLWRGRLALSDVVMSTRPGHPAGFRLAVALERRARALRALAKRAVASWRQRRGGGDPSRAI